MGGAAVADVRRAPKPDSDFLFLLADGVDVSEIHPMMPDGADPAGGLPAVGPGRSAYIYI